MKTKHTKGPWRIKTSVHPTTEGRAWGWVGQNKIHPLDKIPGVNVTWEEGKVSEANAQLISAAPTMIEALINIKEILESPNLIDAGVLRRITDSAIKKAIGE